MEKMSEKLKNTDISNEEVIDDLTKDLAFSLQSEDKELVMEPDRRTEDFAASSGDSTKENVWADVPLNDEEADKTDKFEESEKDSDTDSIDEASLKDAEMDLTDDQKSEKQAIAEELKVAGNFSFKVGEYERSIEKYTEGLRICPLQFSRQRAILYCNRGAAKMKQERYKKAVKDCTKAIELDDTYLKAYHRRAQSYEAIDSLDESLADYKKVIELDPTQKDAQNALTRLPPLIEERNEKLKTEMLGKLKDLGNMFLKPFGLSTNNFQLEQDPESKGYKINFKQ